MKNQGNRKGGIVALVFGIIMAAFSVSAAVIFSSVSGSMGGPTMPFYLFPLVGGSAIVLIFVGLGLSMLIKGNRSRKIMQTGRKTECKVHNVLCIRNGYQLIVTFRGDSGNEFKHMLYINYRDAALLKPDMTIECYVQGDNCYIDESHIVIKEDGDF